MVAIAEVCSWIALIGLFAALTSTLGRFRRHDRRIGGTPRTLTRGRTNETNGVAVFISHLPVYLAPVLYWRRVRLAWRNWADEDFLVWVGRCGFAGARQFYGLGTIAGALLIDDFVQAGPGSASPGGPPWPLWITAATLAWALMNWIVALAPLWASWRFERVHPGNRAPGEDPDSWHARVKARRAWNRALWDAEFARTGKTPRELLKEQRRRKRAAS